MMVRNEARSPWNDLQVHSMNCYRILFYHVYCVIGLNVDCRADEVIARRAEDREVPGSSPGHPRLTFQSCSHYQLNQLGSKAASESTFKSRILAGYQDFAFFFTFMKWKTV